MRSILQSGLTTGGKEGRLRVFFTALDPMNEEPQEEYQGLSLQEQVEKESKMRSIG